MRVAASIQWTALGVGLRAAALSLCAACGGGSAVQPVAFSHAAHVGERSIACADCHRGVTSGEAAGVPGIAVCKDCHEEAVGSSAEEKKVVEAIKAGRELPWQRLYRVPLHVRYPHARHVVAGRIECEKCHGPVAAAAAPPPRPFTALTMDFCLDCHEKSGATTDCIACHR